ncbi:MAG: lipoyl domain-containing protein [Verrucomicrobiae bacterium]|nr:lipoyl domain-containing protein [Verrucomicrobiae bacterium]
MQIVMPQLNDAGDPGVVSEIFVKVGDPVAVGQPVMAVEMEKAVIEIEATAAGTVREIAVQVGDHVNVGQVLIQLD